MSDVDEKNFASRLRAQLDTVETTAPPWPSAKSKFRRQNRARRIRLAAMASSGLAVAAVAILLAAVVPGQRPAPGNGASSGAGKTGGVTRPDAPVVGAPPPGAVRVTDRMAGQARFLIFVSGRNLLGPVPSSTEIGAGNSAWSASRNKAVLATSLHGDALWSPTVNSARSMVVFVQGDAAQIGEHSGAGNLVIEAIDGSHARLVTTDNNDADPQWSPNGKQIAFLRGGLVWLMSAAGSHQHALGFGPEAHTISWSPDGRELAIGSGQSPERIGIINIAHRSLRWFTKARGVEQYDPAWSPNGKEIVYGQTGPNSLFVSNVDGSHARRLTTCTPPHCTQDVEPSWSPDGSEIAFVRSVYGVQQIAVVRSAGGKVRVITAGPEQHNLPNW